MKNILKSILSAARRVVDSDNDGKIELSDLPGTLAKLAAARAQATATIAAIDAMVSGFKALAGSGATANGVGLTEADVEAAWTRANMPFATAASAATARQRDGDAV